jgi:disulfide bond formation protein DsbB
MRPLVSVVRVSTFFATGTIILGILVLSGALLWLAARFSPGAARFWGSVSDALGEQALLLAWLMAMAATLGSLYYSEIAGFVPCTFCWYQRIAMYPLAVILGIAAFRRDRDVWWFAVPLAAAGAGLAAYHYLIQHVPELAGGACSVGVPCTAAYVWRFGFVSIPLMALVSFAVILLLAVVSRGGRASVSP